MLRSERIAQKINEKIKVWLKDHTRLIVAIDGYAGSGKTTVANFIAKQNPYALNHIKYVITLDDDSILPIGAGKRLVGTMADPINRPVFSGKNNMVTSGYTILQPRMEIHPKSTRYLVRALEIYHTTGEKKSDTFIQQEVDRPILMIGLRRDKEETNRRINLRIKEMLANGLIDEVQ